MKKQILPILVLFLTLGCASIKNRANKTFTAEEKRFIMKADSLTPMRIYKITNKKDSVLLRTKSHYVKPNPNDLILQSFVNRLFATVRDSMSMGVGIAAPQVGVLKNIIWVQRFDKENFTFEVYLNPTIVQYSVKKQTFKEGCLSIPDRRDTLNNRAYAILIEYDTMHGKHKAEMVENFTAVIFQHEIDHLNGILYLDHFEKEVLGVEE
jgi:peptide deformylase